MVSPRNKHTGESSPVGSPTAGARTRLQRHDSNGSVVSESSLLPRTLTGAGGSSPSNARPLSAQARSRLEAASQEDGSEETQSSNAAPASEEASRAGATSAAPAPEPPADDVELQQELALQVSDDAPVGPDSVQPPGESLTPAPPPPAEEPPDLPPEAEPGAAPDPWKAAEFHRLSTIPERRSDVSSFGLEPPHEPAPAAEAAPEREGAAESDAAPEREAAAENGVPPSEEKAQASSAAAEEVAYDFQLPPTSEQVDEPEPPAAPAPTPEAPAQEAVADAPAAPEDPEVGGDAPAAPAPAPAPGPSAAPPAEAAPELEEDCPPPPSGDKPPPPGREPVEEEFEAPAGLSPAAEVGSDAPLTAAPGALDSLQPEPELSVESRGMETMPLEPPAEADGEPALEYEQREATDVICQAPDFFAAAPAMEQGVVPTAPSAPVPAISVSKGSRVVVRGAILVPEANGSYSLQQAPSRPGQRPDFRLVKDGRSSFVISWTKRASANDILRKSTVCCISRLTRRGGYKDLQLVYEAPADGIWRLPLSGWRAASESQAAGQPIIEESTLEIADVGTFSRLAAEFGATRAALHELRSMVGHEMGGNFRRADPRKDKVFSGDDGDDGEMFDVGNAVVLHGDEVFARHALQKAGLAWDERIPRMKGWSLRVAKLPSEGRVVVRLPEEFGEPRTMEVPDVMLDRDFTHIWSFYTSRPYFIVAQTLLCVVLWTWFAVRDNGRGGVPFTKTMGGLESVWPGRTSLLLSHDCEDYRSEIWRWWSYQFSHVGLSHIAANTAVNLLLGVPLEKFHGTLRFALMYELGVFGGACCYFVAEGHRPVVGTSGGCFSLIGIRFGDLIMNWTERPYRYFRLVFLTVLVAVNIAVEASNDPEGGCSTSNAAHVGGAFMGLLASIVIGRNLVVVRREQFQIAVAAVLAIVWVGFCLGRGLQWPTQNLFEDDPWCWMRQVSNETIFGDWDWQCVRCHSSECIQEWSLQQRLYTVLEEECAARGGFAITEA